MEQNIRVTTLLAHSNSYGPDFVKDPGDSYELLTHAAAVLIDDGTVAPVVDTPAPDPDPAPIADDAA